MKAAVRTRYGPPDTVSVREIPEPEPAAGELLVRVHATTVNRTDRGYRAGTPFIIRFFSGILRPKVAVLGTEFAGVVDAVGDGVTAFAPGDRVFGYDERTFGAHAEYTTIPADGSVAAMPDGFTFEQAAPGTEGAHYALANLWAANVGAGTELLVYGATGAIGSAAVQLAASLGASVTGVCRGEHLDLVSGLGADRVIDYMSDDFTADGSYDVVFDAVGKTSFARCRPVLRPGGVFLATDFGPFPWNPVLALTTRVVGDRRVRFPFPQDDQQIVTYLRERMQAGEFRPLIDRTYPLDEIVEAYRYVDTGQKVGNVVISVA